MGEVRREGWGGGEGVGTQRQARANGRRDDPYTHLGGEQWDVLDDGHAHAPLSVLCKLRDGWQQRLRQLLDSDDGGGGMQRGDDVEADLREIVIEELQEERQQLLHGRLAAHERSDTENDGGDGGAHVLRRVARELRRRDQTRNADNGTRTRSMTRLRPPNGGRCGQQAAGRPRSDDDAGLPRRPCHARERPQRPVLSRVPRTSRKQGISWASTASAESIWAKAADLNAAAVRTCHRGVERERASEMKEPTATETSDGEAAQK